MSDPVSSLLAAIEAKEAKALRVKADWRQVGQTGVIVATDSGRNPEECANGNWAGIAEFIVDNDPAAVLRRCAGDRKVFWHHGTYYVNDQGEKICDGPGAEPWPCLDFVALADRYGISVEEETTGG